MTTIHNEACGCSGPHAQRAAALLPAILLAILPKCPMCLAIWLGIAGAAGADSLSVLRVAWSMPVQAGLLGVTIGMLAWRARHTREWAPVYFGIIGAVGLFAGRFLDQPALLWTGLALLIVAAGTTARRKEKTNEEHQHRVPIASR